MNLSIEAERIQIPHRPIILKQLYLSSIVIILVTPPKKNSDYYILVEILHLYIIELFHFEFKIGPLRPINS